MEEVKEFVGHVIFGGALFTEDQYGWYRYPLLILLAIWLFINVYIGAMNLYYNIKDRKANRSSYRPDKFFDAVQKLIKHKQRKKSLAVFVPAALAFIASFILMLMGTGYIACEGADLQLLFDIGFFLFLASFLYGMVLFLKFGDLTGVGAALSYKIDYLPPQYVTETTYEKWDYEPDSAYRAVGASNTYDVNAGENMARAAENVFYKIIGIVFVLFNALWFLIKSIAQSVILFFSVLFGTGAKRRAEQACRNDIQLFATGARVGYEDHFTYNYEAVYQSACDDARLNLSPESYLAARIEAGQFYYLFGQCVEGLNTGRAPLMIATKIDKYRYMYFQADRKICEYRDADKHGFIYESARGRIFVVRDERVGLNDDGGLVSYFFPFQPSDQWIIGLWGSHPYCERDRIKAKSLQYHYLKFMKQRYRGDEVVRIMVLVKNQNVITPKMANVALCDVTIDEQNASYLIARFQ